MADWPSTLPQNPYANSGNPQYQPHDNVLETKMDVGRPKRRRRSTSTYEDFTFSMILDSTQLATLITFYKTTLSEVLPFNWIDFRTGTAAIYKFTAPPKETWVGGDGEYWRVQFQLELQS